MADRFEVPYPSPEACVAFLNANGANVYRIHEAMKVDVPAIVKAEVERALEMVHRHPETWGTGWCAEDWERWYLASRFGEPEKDPTERLWRDRPAEFVGLGFITPAERAFLKALAAQACADDCSSGGGTYRSADRAVWDAAREVVKDCGMAGCSLSAPHTHGLERFV